ncbi:MAG: hypothetical protein K8S15_12725 [Candidatus Aegiribacteria sp.]|nr:hypothetical protein [Candidatus Aegiribacteria sp.]
MLRGIILILSLLSAHSPEEAIQDTWNSLQDGSPDSFLCTLTPACSANILRLCSEYLDLMKTLSNEELGELFASFRLEAAPNEIEFWNNTAVLEMIISSPGQHQIINNSTITIDSIHAADGTAEVFVTINMPNNQSASLELPVTASPPGWHTAGLEDLTEILLENTIGE